MKKYTLLFICTLFMAFSAHSQDVLYANNFDNDGDLDDFIVLDNDGFSSEFFEYQTWAQGPIIVEGGDRALFSTSHYDFSYNPSDDWLISPAFEIPASGANASWDIHHITFIYYDLMPTIEILVSTTGTDIADFSPIFFSQDITTEDIKQTVSLDAYAGQTIHVAWRDRSTACDFLTLDNIVIESLPDYGIRAEDNGGTHVNEKNEVLNPTVTFYNEGKETINSIDLMYTFDGSTGTETITGLNIPTYGSYTFSLPPTTLAEAKQYDLEYTFSNPNGETEDMTNNTGMGHYFAVEENASDRVVVAEVAQGTWCDLCPKGKVYLESLTAEHPDDFIGIAAHGGDHLMIPGYPGDLDFLSYPNTHLNRKIRDFDPEYIFPTNFNIIKNGVNPFSISVKSYFDDATGLLTVVPTAASSIAMNTEDFRFALVLTEDDLSGTTSEWAQGNWFSGGDLGPMGGFEDLPNPVPAEDMVYNNIARALVGGFDGEEESMTEFAANEEFSHTFEYDLPENMNFDNIHTIVMIIDQVTGEIMNASKLDSEMIVISSVSDKYETIESKIFPNPATDIAQVEISLEQTEDVNIAVYNLAGQLIMTRDYQNVSGTQTFPINVRNFDSGLYLVQINTENGMTTKKLSVIK